MANLPKGEFTTYFSLYVAGNLILSSSANLSQNLISGFTGPYWSKMFCSTELTIALFSFGISWMLVASFSLTFSLRPASRPSITFFSNSLSSSVRNSAWLLNLLPALTRSSVIFPAPPLRVYLAILVTFPSPKKNQLFLPKTDRVEQYLILKVLIQWFQISFQIGGTLSLSLRKRC